MAMPIVTSSGVQIREDPNNAVAEALSKGIEKTVTAWAEKETAKKIDAYNTLMGGWSKLTTDQKVAMEQKNPGFRQQVYTAAGKIGRSKEMVDTEMAFPTPAEVDIADKKMREEARLIQQKQDVAEKIRTGQDISFIDEQEMGWDKLTPSAEAEKDAALYTLKMFNSMDNRDEFGVLRPDGITQEQANVALATLDKIGKGGGTTGAAYRASIKDRAVSQELGGKVSGLGEPSQAQMNVLQQPVTGTGVTPEMATQKVADIKKDVIDKRIADVKSRILKEGDIYTPKSNVEETIKKLPENARIIPEAMLSTGKAVMSTIREKGASGIFKEMIGALRSYILEHGRMPQEKWINSYIENKYGKGKKGMSEDEKENIRLKIDDYIRRGLGGGIGLNE